MSIPVNKVNKLPILAMLMKLTSIKYVFETLQFPKLQQTSVLTLAGAATEFATRS